jgi:positive regulator of sigma E activity
MNIDKNESTGFKESEKTKMEIVYIAGSFVSMLGAFVLIFSFAKDFKKLATMQKIAICIVALGTIVPFAAGCVEGFLSR